MVEKQIVIMGAGLAGLSAAVSAREKGAEVLVLESRKCVGGISVTGMGLFAVESHHQKERNLDTVFTKDDAFEFIMDRTHWQLDAKIAGHMLTSQRIPLNGWKIWGFILS